MTEKYQSVKQRVSYGIGRQMGEQLVQNPFEGMDVSAVSEGLVSAVSGQESAVDPRLLEEAFSAIRARMEAEQAEKGELEAAAGEEFLAANAKRDGVTVTASGMQYEVVTEGDGELPIATSTVRTHYHGTLIDGTVFDSSYQRGQPAEFPVNGVISGWTEALMMMPVGSKWRLYLPHKLAYGERGAGGKIKPYAALIFDVELIAILG